MQYSYKGNSYPEYLRSHNAMQFIAPVAKQFCIGAGVDLGCGKKPLSGAVGKDSIYGDNLHDFPEVNLDYIFSSHCLEHIVDPIGALKYWKKKLRPGGCMFLYLPHPDMEYWKPENCLKHMHIWYPRDMVSIFKTLGFSDVLHSERDMAWSFSVVGYA